MKKLLLIAVLVIGLSVLAYAQSTTEVANQIAEELKNAGVITAQEVPSVESSVKELVKSGVSVNEAKNIVAQAAHQAKSQGLKGKELAAKVHEAVKARKAQLEEAKKKAKEAEKKAKEEAKKKEKEAKKKLEKESKKAKEKTHRAIKDLNKKWGQ